MCGKRLIGGGGLGYRVPEGEVTRSEEIVV